MNEPDEAMVGAVAVETLAKVLAAFEDVDAHSAVVLQRIADLVQGVDEPWWVGGGPETERQQVRDLLGEWFDDFTVADRLIGHLGRSGFAVTRTASLAMLRDAAGDRS